MALLELVTQTTKVWKESSSRHSKYVFIQYSVILQNLLSSNGHQQIKS